MKVLKIGLFLDCYEPLVGGVIISTKALKEGLEAIGHEVYVITLESVPAVKDVKDNYIIRLPGIPYPFKHFKDYRFLWRYKKYLNIIKSLNLDIIHIQTEQSIGKLALYAKKKLKLGSLYTMHSFYDLYINKIFFWWPKFLKKIALKYIIKLHRKFISQTDVTILPSNKSLQSLINKYQISGNYEIIPTQLNLKPFYRENNSLKDIMFLKKKFNLENMFVCLYVGRLSEEKEVDYLISAFAVFLGKIPNSKFLIIGDGPAKNKLQNQVKKLKIISHVIFLGMIPYQKLGLYYQLGDVFISASLYETQGLTFIEALAASLPLIARYDVVLESILHNGKNGFFFHKPTELVEFLVSLTHNQKKYQQMVLATKKTILKYDPLYFAQKMSKIYEKIIQNNYQPKNLLK